MLFEEIVDGGTDRCQMDDGQMDDGQISTTIAYLEHFVPR